MNGYSIEELGIYQDYLHSQLGDATESLELVFEDRHVLFYLFKPNEKDSCYRLVSQGMRTRQNDCLEVILELPNWWNVDAVKQHDHQWLMPIYESIQAGVNMEEDEPNQNGYIYFDKRMMTQEWPFSATLFTSFEDFESCDLPTRSIEFYQVSFLYEEEVDFYQEIDIREIRAEFVESIRVVNPNRYSVMTQILQEFDLDELDAMMDEVDMDEDDEESVLDFYAWHAHSQEKIDAMPNPENAASHITIYLKWCMTHGMMSEAFEESFGEMLASFDERTPIKDYRDFVLRELNGLLLIEYFNELGQEFAHYYYSDNEYPNYPHDVDLYTFKFYGEDRYHEEFKTEGYLSFDLNESYEAGMFHYIQKRYDAWIRTKDLKISIDTPDAVTMAFRKYLGCECTYFAPSIDDDVISAAYEYALIDRKPEGYIPVLIQVDEHLWETVVRMHGHGNDDNFEFDEKLVQAYREEMLAKQDDNGKKYVVFDPEVMNDFEIGGGEANDVFLSYWNYETEKTYPLILAKIPVNNPWEVFAYIPFGGWNQCPDTEELMGVAQYWYEAYGAMPAVIRASECEFALTTPVSKEAAKQCAVEQYLFCPDLDQNVESIGVLADMISKSTKWYFWWD